MIVILVLLTFFPYHGQCGYLLLRASEGLLHLDLLGLLGVVEGVQLLEVLLHVAARALRLAQSNLETAHVKLG